VANGVAWFDGILQDETGQWVLGALTFDQRKMAHRRLTLAESVGMDMTTLGSWSQIRTATFFEAFSISLSGGQRLMDARPVLRKLWPGLPVSDRHTVFRFDVGEQVYLVPALFLISRLFLTVRSVAKYLLQPGMFESFIDPAPVVHPDIVQIRLPTHLSVNQCSEGLARAMAWLSIDQSAARAWRSVWFKAMSGCIDLDLPTATMHGRFGGIEIDGVRLVSWSREMTVNTGLPDLLQVTSRRGTQKTFKRGGCI
jgi:hypothetical protein